MLLQNRQLTFKVPHTSTCIIRTRGHINDGDIVEVVSPVFASANFQTGSITMTETFNVPIRILTESRFIDNDDDVDTQASLVCDDNDIFNMYVRVQ
jgi:hypothetical protein